LRNNSLLASAKFRFIILGALFAIILILLYLYYFKDDNIAGNDLSTLDSNKKTTDSVSFEPQTNLNRSIDSILFTFGIKKEWITTEIQKKQNQKAEWFVKNVMIPKDLTSVEINLDISSYLNHIGMNSKVNENILNKDITISVNNPETTKQLPAAIINITHNDKAVRESGIIAIVIDKINSFSAEDIEKLVINKNEFSYVFPRNLDDIDIQQKLLHHKKDVVIGLTYSAGENYESDFNSAMDEKAIREKVKNFALDYTSINKVLLTCPTGDASLSQLRNRISAEFARANISVINDSMLVNAYSSGEKDRTGMFFNNVIQKTNLLRNIIVVYPAEKSEFEDFYSRVMVYKKLGYKFVNLSGYFMAIEERKKKEQQLLEKQKQSEDSKKKTEEIKKKKSGDVKVPPQKELKQKPKTEKPKQQPKKQTDKKKK
jgi:hypothetical protein